MAVTVALSTKALVTAAEAEAYVFGDEATELSDSQKDNLYLLINSVSGLFESFIGLPLIKRTFEEIVDGTGKSSHWLSAYPASLLTVSERADYNSVWVAMAATGYYLYADIGRVRFINVIPASGFATLKFAYTAGLGTQTRTVGTGELTAVTIADEWKAMALQAVNHLHAKDLASFSRVQEGVMIPASALPPLVREFLQRNQRVII